MEKELYYAVNGSGQGVVFIDQPVRNDVFKVLEGTMVGVFSSLVMQLESEGFKLPVMTWNDYPMKLEISLKVCESDE